MTPKGASEWLESVLCITIPSMNLFSMVILTLFLIKKVESKTQDLLLLDLHLDKKLTLTNNISSPTKSYQVNNKFECFGKCEDNIEWCQAGNFKTIPENTNQHFCELLPSDRFTNTNILQGDHDYQHFNIKTQCHIKDKPCLNEGKCIDGKCRCTELYTGEQCQDPKSCKTHLLSNSSLQSGIYTIFPNDSQPLKVYCDMEMEGGGWTLVWSFTFTNYAHYTHASNAVTPRPSWPGAGNIQLSTTPPLNETDYNAMDFNLWKMLAGDEFIVKSNINHWVYCKEGTGSLVHLSVGSIACRVIKNVASACLDSAPNKIKLASYGPIIVKTGSPYYVFDVSTYGMHFPAFGPCRSPLLQYVKGVANPHGNIYLR